MININLLPGSGKKKASRGGAPKMDLGAAFAGLSARVKDKFLAAAVVSVIVAGAGLAFMYTGQTRKEADLADKLEKARTDSVRYAAVVKERTRVTARRDTVLRQLNIIKSIDNDRFVWPHIMDEVSRALPAYTWLQVLNFSGTPQGTNNPAALTTAKAPAGALPTEIPPDNINVRMIGQTVDIQALTRFMKQLEASPFLENVQLQKSELAIASGQEVTQFTLDVSYTRPDSSEIRRVPLRVSVR